MDDSTGEEHAAVHNDLSGAVSGPVVQARSIGSVTFQLPATTSPVPLQLPNAPRFFATRDGELRTLRRWRGENGDRPLLLVVSGPAGVGKTTLALRWLHDMHDEHPDGQLFVELSDADSVPVTPDEALDWLLRSLGVAAKDVPAGRARREALFRTLTAERSVAVLLDDALSAAQVRPLIPAGSRSVVVVTSRMRLSGLAMDGAWVLDVDPLNAAASVELLRAVVGPRRVGAEPAAAAELASLCGGLPLALSIVGARLAARPRRSLAREVSELRAEQSRLEGLALDDDVSVEAVLDMSYRSLSLDSRELYRLIGLHPGPEFGVEVLAAVSGWQRQRAGSAVDGAVEANVLTEVQEDRFRCHDLVRLHAQRVAEQGSDDCAAVRRRVIEWYLDRVVAADVVIHPLRPRLGPRYSEPARLEVVGDRGAALGWMEVERRNVRCAVQVAFDEQHHELVWQFCEALWGFFLHTRHYTEWTEMHELGLRSSVLCGDRRAEARLRSQQGFAYAKLGRFDDAITQNTRALQLAEQVGDAQASATALSQLGRAAKGQGDLDTALEYYQRARIMQQDLGEVRGVALCTRRIGDILGRLGHPHEALTELHQAAAMMEQLGDQTQHARALMEIGKAGLRAGMAERAAPPLEQALMMMREFGSLYYQAEILAELARVAQARGDLDTARAHYREAIDLYTTVEDPQAEVLQELLDAMRDAAQPE
ncbi:MAG: ATP-binding protein [Pseudonocardiaceae bacterium]